MHFMPHGKLIRQLKITDHVVRNAGWEVCNRRYETCFAPMDFEQNLISHPPGLPPVTGTNGML